jgi:glycerol-3-phosphate dehydrogenase
MAVKRYFGSETIVVIVAKGLDPRSHTFLFDALQQKLSQKIVVLSGTMFSIDMVHDSPFKGYWREKIIRQQRK